MTVVSAHRLRLLLSTAAGSLIVVALAFASSAAARAFPEAAPGQTFAVAGTTTDAPQVSLTVSGAVGQGAPLSASATALTSLASIGVGYCPGWTCSAAFASEIASAPGGVLKSLWTGLPPDGTYTLVAYAVTTQGIGGESAPVTVTVDTTPPETSIVSAPPPTTPVDSATFQLASNEPGATFQCKIDTTSTWTDCSSPVVVFGVAAGSHRLTARAVDAAGNVDPTPVAASWKANAPAAPPETTITSAPSGLVNTRNQSIQFTSNNPLASFQCDLDGTGFVACLNPRPVLNKADGPHVFRVRAVVGGVADPTPAEASWTIDATGPAVTLTASRPADGKGFYGHAVTFTTTATDAGGAVTCTDPQTYDGPDVSHLAIVGSCTDAAGNTKTKTFDLRYDTTPPSVHVSFRVRDRNGWYNRPFKITWTGTDNTGGSGGVTCTTTPQYTGPDTPSGVLTGSCSDAVGNTASGSFPFAYDDTDPVVTATPSRAPDSGTWYNAPLSVSFSGTDAMSGGVTCDAPVDYTGPDSGTAGVTGQCSDAAGNSVPVTVPLAYDATPPVVTATAGRAPDQNSWYNAPVAIAFSGADATSGGVSCDPTRLYGGPDRADATVIGSCSDAAGNYASASLGLAYDATGPTVSVAPDRPTDHNAWYNHAVSFATAGIDSASGVASCTLPQSYFAPDSATASISGTCTDVAGNTTTTSTSFKYDATAPTATAVPSATANAAGWHNAAFSVSFSGTDLTSGPVTCSPAAGYSGPDSPFASIGGSCTDQAGNTTAAPDYNFKYDATAPAVTALASRATDSNGWYNHPVSVSFGGTDALSKVVSCDASRTLSTDAAAALVAGTCTDAAGNVGSGSVGISYDATGPTVTASPSRAANANGWYRASVGVSFAGIDTLSGLASCAPATTYSGPDTAATTVSGTCTDVAGNSGTSGYSVQYDATAPTVSVTAQRPPDSGGAYTSPITFGVTGTDATSNGVTCDGPKTYSGPDSSSATVDGACSDAAGNQGTASATFSYQTTVLDTNLGQTPALLTNHTTDQFTFSATRTPATFTCVLDGTSSACTSPFTVSNLTDGQHTFSVAAKDGAGNTDASPATFTWTVDTLAPDTTLDSSGVFDPNTGPASFPLTSEAGAVFQCSLDGATFTSCTSPASYPVPPLADGRHTFQARAVDAAGNVDATPASFSWTEDSTPPTATFTATPPATAAPTSATFNWTTNEPTKSQCRLDGVLTSPACPTALSTTGTKTLNVTGGTHTFSVRVSDAAGNAATITFTWSVNSGPPDTTIDLVSQPANPTSSTSALFTFTSTKPPSTFQCKLDGAVSFTACSSPQSYAGLASGTHTFSVAAIDSQNNVDPSPATYTWLVDATSPTGSITSPVEAATVNGSVSVSANANDNVSVLSVQLKLDGGDLGLPVTSAPFSTNWDTTQTSDGAHTLTAVVTDEVGNTTTTAPVHVTVANTAHPTATATPDLVDVGTGSVDATTRNVIRTAAGRVYIIANDDHGLTLATRSANGGAGVIHAYKGNQNGTPTAFTEVDTANHPVSGGRATNTSAFGGVDVRLGGDGVARTIFNDNAGTFELDYRTFSTVTDTWGPAETIDTGVGEQLRGRIKYALALDANNVPHVVYAKGSSLLYTNRASGTWSAPVTIATGTPLHPMLAFDNAGVLHLTWLEDTGAGSSLRYASRSGTTWSAPELIPTNAILSNGNADQGPSIATDSAGHPYVLYVGPSLGTFGPVGRTALYGAIKIMEKIGATWTDVSPTTDMLTHTPQVYLRGNDLYAFTGHDTDINFGYNRRLAGQSWGTATKLTKILADGSASVRWDPLHETDSSIIDAATFNEDRLGDRSFLGEVYYSAVLPTAADPTPPTVSLTAPAAGTVTGSVALSATAADNVGVAGVTFKVDGSAILAEDTVSPYTVNWDSSTVANGTHTITAVARDAAGNTTTSTGVTVTVSNAGTPPPAATGLTLFGSATAAPSVDTNAPGQIEAFDVGTVTAGTITRMHVFLDTPLPPSVLVGLYTNNAGKPGTLMASTSVTAPVAGWNDVGFGPVALTAGQHYWVALLTPSGAAVGPHFRDARGGGAGLWIGSLGLSALPSSWPTGGTPNTDGPLSTYGSTS